MREKLQQFIQTEVDSQMKDLEKVKVENKKLKLDYYRIKQQLKQKGILDFIDENKF